MMRARPFVQVYPTSQLNGWAYLTDAVAPSILRGCHGDERKIVEIYEEACDERGCGRLRNDAEDDVLQGERCELPAK